MPVAQQLISARKGMGAKVRTFNRQEGQTQLDQTWKRMGLSLEINQKELCGACGQGSLVPKQWGAAHSTPQSWLAHKHPWERGGNAWWNGWALQQPGQMHGLQGAQPVWIVTAVCLLCQELVGTPPPCSPPLQYPLAKQLCTQQELFPEECSLFLLTAEPRAMSLTDH